MALGAGKYGDIATELQQRFHAKGIILVVLDGDQGNGIELCGPAILHAGVPGFLEAVAKDIRRNAQADAAAISAAEGKA